MSHKQLSADELARQLMIEAGFPEGSPGVMEGVPDCWRVRQSAALKLQSVLEKAHQDGLIPEVNTELVALARTYAYMGDDAANSMMYTYSLTLQVVQAHTRRYSPAKQAQILALLKKGKESWTPIDVMEFPESIWVEVFRDIGSSFWNAVKRLFRQ